MFWTKITAARLKIALTCARPTTRNGKRARESAWESERERAEKGSALASQAVVSMGEQPRCSPVRFSRKSEKLLRWQGSQDFVRIFEKCSKTWSTVCSFSSFCLKSRLHWRRQQLWNVVAFSEVSVYCFPSCFVITTENKKTNLLSKVSRCTYWSFPFSKGSLIYVCMYVKEPLMKGKDQHSWPPCTN